MNRKVIVAGLEAALSLLNSEFDSVCIEELMNEYKEVIRQVELALEEITKN